MVNFNHIQPAGWCAERTLSFGGAKSLPGAKSKGSPADGRTIVRPRGPSLAGESAAFGMTTGKASCKRNFLSWQE